LYSPNSPNSSYISILISTTKGAIVTVSLSAMYGALSETLGTAIKFLHLGNVRIDNWMFRLHYVVR
jgi:hypothetical protein